MMTSLDEIDRIYQTYFKETFDQLGFIKYETSLGSDLGDWIKFKCNFFLVQLIDEQVIEVDISPSYGTEQFCGIESYHALLSLMDPPDNLNENESRKILRARLGFEDQCKFLSDQFKRLCQILDKEHYKENLREIEKIGSSK